MIFLIVERHENLVKLCLTTEQPFCLNLPKKKVYFAKHFDQLYHYHQQINERKLENEQMVHCDILFFIQTKAYNNKTCIIATINRGLLPLLSAYFKFTEGQNTERRKK